MRREFLMLAHPYDAKKHGIGGWMLSEKLDGQRAFWDGGITRGLYKDEVPWANTAKDERYVSRQVSTGLWSRYGNVIHAPSWWLDQLPAMFLDGELWTDRTQGGRQDLSKIIKTITPGLGWERVRYHVFDTPPPHAFLSDGQIKNPNFTKFLKGLHQWFMAEDHKKKLVACPSGLTGFTSSLKLLERYVAGNIAIIHTQTQLPYQTNAAIDLIEENLENVVSVGGEGLMLRQAESYWEPRRSHKLLKVKKFDDDEATVVGYITGRETDKGSKLLGLMGALVTSYKGKRLELSGFTDDERLLDGKAATDWAVEHPGQEAPSWVISTHFPRGSSVTFKYRGLTKDGIPQEARYWRRREV